MEFRNLRTFHAVASSGSHAKAAQMLGYTQSTVTVHLQQLERDLGVKLFERIGRRMVLTDKGREVLEHARFILDAAARLEDCCADDEALRGSLRIASAETILCYALAPVIEEFRARAPEVDLKIMSRTCAQTPLSLKDGTCDIGFTYLDQWDRTRFDVETLCETTLIPIAAAGPDLPDLRQRNQAIRKPLIADEPDNVIRQRFERYLDERSISFDGAIEMWSTQAVRCCVAAGIGFSVLPRFAVDDLGGEALVPLDWDGQEETVPIVCARASSRYETAPMRLFLQIARRVLAENPRLIPA